MRKERLIFGAAYEAVDVILKNNGENYAGRI